MIKIVKHGKFFDQYKCTCKICGCEFIADGRDFRNVFHDSPIGGVTASWLIACPDCYMVIDLKDTELIKEDAHDRDT